MWEEGAEQELSVGGRCPHSRPQLQPHGRPHCRSRQRPSSPVFRHRLGTGSAPTLRKVRAPYHPLFACHQGPPHSFPCYRCGDCGARKGSHLPTWHSRQVAGQGLKPGGRATEHTLSLAVLPALEDWRQPGSHLLPPERAQARPPAGTLWPDVAPHVGIWDEDPGLLTARRPSPLVPSSPGFLELIRSEAQGNRSCPSL